MKCLPAICAIYVTAFLLCNFNENKKVSEKVVFSALLNAYQLEGGVFVQRYKVSTF